jgi:hypothetical protein
MIVKRFVGALVGGMSLGQYIRRVLSEYSSCHLLKMVLPSSVWFTAEALRTLRGRIRNSKFEFRNITLWLIPFSKPLERLERLERFERLKPAQRGLLSG